LDRTSARQSGRLIHDADYISARAKRDGELGLAWRVRADLTEILHKFGLLSPLALPPVPNMNFHLYGDLNNGNANPTPGANGPIIDITAIDRLPDDKLAAIAKYIGSEDSDSLLQP
jgi:hypothetical protein